MTKSDTIVRQLATGSVISVAASILIGLLNYLTRRTLALGLPETAYGFFYSAFSFVMLFLAYLDLGLNSSGTILMARHDTHGRHSRAQAVYSIVFFLKLVGGLSVGLVLALFAPFLVRQYFGYPEGLLGLVVLCLFIPANALCGTVVSTLDAYREFLARNVFQALKFGLILLAVLLFAKNHPNTGPAGAYAAGATCMFLVGMVYLWRRRALTPRMPDRDVVSSTWHETWQFGKWVAISTAGMTTMFYMDTLMLTPMRGLESVALYNVALPVMQIMQSVMVLPLIFMPVAAGLWQKREARALAGLIDLLVEACILFLCVVTVAMTCLRTVVIRILFSARFEEAGTALVILCAAMSVLVLGQFLIYTLNAMDRPRLVARIVGTGVLVNVLANATLIPMFDIEGAALATLVSYVLISALAYAGMRRELTLSFHFRSIMPACATTMGLLVLLIVFRPEITGIEAVIAGAVTVSVLCLVMLVFNRSLLRRLFRYSGGQLSN